MLCTVLSLGLAAQSKKELLIGEWNFKEVHQGEKLNPQQLQAFNTFFVGMKLEFSANGSFVFSVMGEKEKGKWTLKGEKKIEMHSSGGNKSTSEIIELRHNLLILKTDEVTLVMKKVRKK
jgi:hypothetical protein